MKTVSGTIVSTKHVSLLKAANILSKFVNFDNGASQAVSAYLCRASIDFNELVYFKRHHKFKNDRPKEEASAKSDLSHRNLEEYEIRVLEHDGVKSEDGKLRKKEKKEKKKKKTDGSLGNGQSDKTEVEVEEGNESVKEKIKEKKKRKNAEVESAENGNSVAPEKKKRRKTKADE